jgi:hypothetical protein
VLFVLCLHLLTTEGTWNVSDQAEMIYTARRLWTAHSFDFAPVGESVPGMRWLQGQPGQPLRPRLFPGTPLALLPFVALDHALELDRDADLGFFVHLSGHLFLAAALLLLGTTLRREGASQRAVIAAILVVGTAWPMWQISRRGGAEPLLALLSAGFLLARSQRSFAGQLCVTLSLPWCHPTGSLLAPVLALSEQHRGRALILLGTALSATLSVFVLWNWLYHGNLFGGGYALYGARRAIVTMNPLEVAAGYLHASLLFAPVLFLLALAGALQGGRASLRVFALPLALLVLQLTLFSLYTTPTAVEPARRLAVVWLVLAYAVGRSFDALPLTRLAAFSLVALSMLNGLYWYRVIEAEFYPWYDVLGVPWAWEPLVLWITWSMEGHPFWHSLLPVVLLSAACGCAAVQTCRAFVATPSR